MRLAGAAEIQVAPGVTNLPAMSSQRDRDASSLLRPDNRTLVFHETIFGCWVRPHAAIEPQDTGDGRVENFWSGC
jgi:hypothetical protein